MGFSRRVATAVQVGCSAAPCLVISVALGPARAVGGMSLMYPLLPVSAAADPSPGLTRRPSRRPARVGTPRAGRRASGIRATGAAIQRRLTKKELGTATKQRGAVDTTPTTPSPRPQVLPAPAAIRGKEPRPRAALSLTTRPTTRRVHKDARPKHGRVHAGQVERCGHDAEITTVPGERGVGRRAKEFVAGPIDGPELAAK